MRVLVACEFSGIVRGAFAAEGHDAWSCDLLPSERPGQHYECNIGDIIQDHWDMMIAHPPCRYLTTTANRSFLNNPGRWQKRLDAMLFVYWLMNAKIERICIENPQGVISTHIRKPEQYIQPYQFGHPVSKKTGLWLKNLPPLVPTKIVEPEWIYPKSEGKRMSKLHAKTSSSNNIANQRLRSRTFQGIADAMADQWNF